jgi:hypothetical protein
MVPREVTFALALGVVVLLLFAGCARFVWVKPGAGQQDFQRDAYECERDMRQSGYFGTGVAAAINAQNFQERCMVARGWSKQQANQDCPPGEVLLSPEYGVWRCQKR